MENKISRIRMRRDRKIVNKAELTRLQRKFESCVGQLLSLEHSKTSAAQLINMLYNIVDRIYIGHIPDIGADALTGVGVCMPLIMIVSAFAALVGYGGAPRASIFMGKQDKESAEKTLGNCFVLQIVISVVLTAVLLIWNRELLLRRSSHRRSHVSGSSASCAERKHS